MPIHAVAMVICCLATALVLLWSDAAWARSYGQPLQFEDPPVDLTPSSEADTNSATSNAPRVSSQTSQRRQAASAGNSGEESAEHPASGNKTSTVYLFNTAEMFRKPIVNNAPQWERVAAAVKKKN